MTFIYHPLKKKKEKEKEKKGTGIFSVPFYKIKDACPLFLLPELQNDEQDGDELRPFRERLRRNGTAAGILVSARWRGSQDAVHDVARLTVYVRGASSDDIVEGVAAMTESELGVESERVSYNILG